MKLLLTSAGITNRSIADALIRLLGGMEPGLVKIGFVPTAANVEAGNKDWFITQLTNLQEHGFTYIDIVDISAPGVDWETRLREVDVVFVSGGNTFHLLDYVRKTGFDNYWHEVAEQKIYVGVSAGSIIATPNIAVCTIPPADENLSGLKDLSGMGLVDYEVEPHCDDTRFVTMEVYSREAKSKLYAIDDQTAIAVDGDTVKVISEGKWKLFSGSL